MGKVFLFSAMFSLIFFVVELAIITVMIVATWKLYKKAGEPGYGGHGGRYQVPGGVRREAAPYSSGGAPGGEYYPLH